MARLLSARSQAQIPAARYRLDKPEKNVIGGYLPAARKPKLSRGCLWTHE